MLLFSYFKKLLFHGALFLGRPNCTFHSTSNQWQECTPIHGVGNWHIDRVVCCQIVPLVTNNHLFCFFFRTKKKGYETQDLSKDDYYFVCRVCLSINPGPAEAHLECERHKVRNSNKPETRDGAIFICDVL